MPWRCLRGALEEADVYLAGDDEIDGVAPERHDDALMIRPHVHRARPQQGAVQQWPDPVRRQYHGTSNGRHRNVEERGIQRQREWAQMTRSLEFPYGPRHGIHKLLAARNDAD